MAKKAEWRVQLDRAAKAFADEITGMTDDELFALSHAKNHVTNSNCWFVSYGLAPLASDIAENEIQLRAEAKAREVAA